MLNYFNFKKIGSKVLLTNDFGSYAFLSQQEFTELISEKDLRDPDRSAELEEKGFLFRGSMEAFTERSIHRMREAKSYLFEPTQLHIFVVTTACNLQCVYCQAQNGSTVPHGYMDEDTARKAVDLALQSPSSRLQFEFQGGEPLLNFKIIRFIVEYSESVAAGKEISYSIVTNLTCLTEEIADFIEQHNINISTSVDGPDFVHDRNRPFKTGAPSFEPAKEKTQYLQSRGISVGAILTTTRESLHHPEEIVAAYRDLGLDCISLRPLTPLGCANAKWSRIGYTPEEFVEFYGKAFDCIVALNRSGVFLSEGLARIFLSKIMNGFAMNYMELRSPCGASVGQLAYYHDGNVYTCDEGRMLAEMGNPAFRLGTVSNRYDELMDSGVCRTVCACSILEGLPSCSDCAYQPYCGVCPAVNYALYGDLTENMPENYHCKIYKGILDKLFSVLCTADEQLIQIFRSWIL